MTTLSEADAIWKAMNAVADKQSENLAEIARLRAELSEALAALEAAQPFVEQVYQAEAGEEAADALYVFNQIAAILAKHKDSTHE